MAPNKFEEHIKKQLEEREIQPSANAWASLSNKLTAAPQSKKRGYLWYGAAASVIGLLVVSIWFLNSDDISSVNDVVISPKDEVKKESSVEVIPQEIEKTKVVESVKSQNIKNRTKSDVKYLVQEKILIGNNKLEMAINTTDSIDETAEILNAKILEVVAQVNSLEQGYISLTDAEVDSLLWQARKELAVNKIFQDTGKVDPMELLTDVEDELDQSFRDKIFERLKMGFVKVRTAVADSDN